MKVLIIDNKNFIPFDCSAYVIIDKLESPDLLSFTVNHNFSYYDLLIINLNYYSENSPRSQNPGITLLKYIRLQNLKQHCVVYSFLSREQLMDQDSANSIIFSKGITFHRLPYNFNYLDFHKLDKIKAPEDLSFFFKAESKLPDNKHFFANWWGVLQLRKVQEAIDKAYGTNDEQFLDDSIICSKEMSSYQGLLSRYLYQPKDKEVEEQLRKFIRKQVEIFDDKYGDVSKTTELLLLQPDDLKLTSIKIASEDYQSPSIFSSSSLNVSQMRDELKKVNPKILFIDDQASEGWSSVFQKIIYGCQNDSFNVIQPLMDATVEDIVKSVISWLTSTVPDLIILDLRLKGEEGTKAEIANLSGLNVLRAIRESAITCPVLITTASNKVRSYIETYALGASAFWTKEGLDERKTIEESIENYFRFVELVYFLCLSDEFRFLNHLKEKTKELEINNKVYWWETSDWVPNFYPYTLNPAKKEEAFSTLNEGIIMLEDFLRLYIQNQGSSLLLLSYPSMIIAKFAIVLEKIHNIVEDSTKQSLGTRMSSQIPQYSNYWEKKLVFPRNRAVHKQNCTYYDLKNFVENLFSYIYDYKIEFNIEGKIELP